MCNGVCVCVMGVIVKDMTWTSVPLPPLVPASESGTSLGTRFAHVELHRKIDICMQLH